MPILGEFTWSETDDHVEVVIPLKGSRKKADVFTASNILKVSYAPYLLDLNLSREVDEESSRAMLKNGILKVCLRKKESQSWGKLCFEGSKEDISQRRQKALKKRDEMVQEQKEKAAAKKVEEDRIFFQKHMALEEREQQRIDQIKATEKKQAEDAMHNTFSQLKCVKSCKKSPKVHFKSTNDTQTTGNTPDESDTSFGGISHQNHKLLDCTKDVNTTVGLPPPREVVQTTFQHTPRLFKTPSRESTTKQEQEFIMKNRSNLKKNVLLNNVDIGDVDPVWLTSKGDEFYSKGDFCSAINAYSEALENDDTIVNALVNRAACYLHLREGTCCIKDCLNALKLNDTIKPQPCPLPADSKGYANEDSAKFRKSLHICLAVAYSLTEEYSTGIEHFTAAYHLDETDNTTTESINFLKTYARAMQLKTQADKCFTNNEIRRAVKLYAEALSIDKENVRVLMNRAACHLALEAPTECIDDCTRALKALKTKPSSSCLTVAAVLFPKPNVHRKWVITLLCRRAAAKRLCDDFSGASEDIDEARLTVHPHGGIDVGEVEKSITGPKKD